MKHLGKLNVCGLPFDIIEASPQEIPELETCYGMCQPDHLQILIHKGLAPELFRDTVIHEMLHAIFVSSGITDFVMGVTGFKRGSKKLNKFEETFIRLLTPHFITALGTMKKLKV